jgi:hypothetical protein
MNRRMEWMRGGKGEEHLDELRFVHWQMSSNQVIGLYSKGYVA